jgi:hypothetical protein
MASPREREREREREVPYAALKVESARPAKAAPSGSVENGPYVLNHGIMVPAYAA